MTQKQTGLFLLTTASQALNKSLAKPGRFSFAFISFLCYMQVDYIILGQGICGTLLSFELYKRGKTFFVIDDANPGASSRIASGLMNPVTGKRYVKSWMYDEFLERALTTYKELEETLEKPLVRKTSLIQFHTAIAEQHAFFDKTIENAEHLHLNSSSEFLKPYFNFAFDTGIIEPCWIVDATTLLSGWREELRKRDRLIEEDFQWSNCQLLPHKVIYKHLEARQLICCEGANAFHNPYFSKLPFSLNKGEVIIARIPDLPKDYLYKQQQLKIVPLKDDLFWIGSSFEWKYENTSTTDQFRTKVEQTLKAWLKLPYNIIAHFAAERPSSVDYRPFVGLHPMHSTLGILNGMGTKGFSQTPFFAQQMADMLCANVPVLPDADIGRFKRILTAV
jgi:glycine/D-amino acid oxidase-like deaminating enzyme